MPVVSALVMPAGMLGLLAMPFGFDGVFWWLMGLGIDWMIAVTRWVADLPGAIGRMAAFGIGPLIVSSLGIILLCLLRTPLRWSGAGVLAFSVAWALAVPQPDLLISGDGHNVGVRAGGDCAMENPGRLWSLCDQAQSARPAVVADGCGHCGERHSAAVPPRSRACRRHAC